MSKYHPLDVRHPANRDLLSRNFLLDPPSQDSGKPSRRQDRSNSSRRGSAPAATQSVQQEPANPWGQRLQQAVTSAQSRNATRRSQGSVTTRSPSLLRWMIIGGVVVWILFRQDGTGAFAELLNDLIDTVEDAFR